MARSKDGVLLCAWREVRLCAGGCCPPPAHTHAHLHTKAAAPGRGSCLAWGWWWVGVGAGGSPAVRILAAWSRRRGARGSGAACTPRAHACLQVGVGGVGGREQGGVGAARKGGGVGTGKCMMMRMMAMPSWGLGERCLQAACNPSDRAVSGKPSHQAGRQARRQAPYVAPGLRTLDTHLRCSHPLIQRTW